MTLVSELVYERPVDPDRDHKRLLRVLGIIDGLYEAYHAGLQGVVSSVAEAFVEDVHFEVGGDDEVDKVLLQISNTVDGLTTSHIKELGMCQCLSLKLHVLAIMRFLRRHPHSQLLLGARHKAINCRIENAVENGQAVDVLIILVQVLDAEFHLPRHLSLISLPTNTRHRSLLDHTLEPLRAFLFVSMCVIRYERHSYFWKM